MSTELYTVQEEDLIELVTNLMEWRKINHVPVENEHGEVVGVISSYDILSYHCRKNDFEENQHATVNDIMQSDPVTITADTTTLEALKLMKQRQIGCLPVVKDKKLIGIVTEYDFVYMSEHLFEELLHIESNGR